MLVAGLFGFDGDKDESTFCDEKGIGRIQEVGIDIRQERAYLFLNLIFVSSIPNLLLALF